MKSVLIAVAAVALTSGGIATGVTTIAADPVPVNCPGTVNDDGVNYTVTSTCTFPKPPPSTVTQPGATTTVTVPGPTTTATVTATSTVTSTVTATPTATPTVTPTPTPTPTPTQPPGVCANTTANTPDGPDGKGGCFPGVSNTGPNAPASAMATYTGPCTITTANVTIDSKVVNCSLSLASGASGFMLKNSYLNGAIHQSSGSPSYTVQDTLVDGGISKPACSNGACPAGKYACTNCGVDGSNMTVLRTEIINTNRAAYCFTTCLIQDNYFHGTNLWPDASNLAHASGMRMEQFGTIRHNTLWCSFNGALAQNDEIGCSADLTGYPDFTAIRNNTIDGNLMMANTNNGFCAYGGWNPGKPHNNDATNATNQKFTNNVFQRGTNGKCGSFGPITSFITTRTGNVWTGNVWDNGGTVPPAE